MIKNAPQFFKYAYCTHSMQSEKEKASDAPWEQSKSRETSQSTFYLPTDP